MKSGSNIWREVNGIAEEAVDHGMLTPLPFEGLWVWNQRNLEKVKLTYMRKVIMMNRIEMSQRKWFWPKTNTKDPLHWRNSQSISHHWKYKEHSVGSWLTFRKECDSSPRPGRKRWLSHNVQMKTRQAPCKILLTFYKEMKCFNS